MELCELKVFTNSASLTHETGSRDQTFNHLIFSKARKIQKVTDAVDKRRDVTTAWVIC